MSDLDAEMHELIEAGRNEPGLTRAEHVQGRERLVRRLGMVAAAGLAGAAATGSVKTAAGAGALSAGGALLGKAVLGLSVVGLVATTYVVMRAPSSRPVPSPIVANAAPVPTAPEAPPLPAADPPPVLPAATPPPADAPPMKAGPSTGSSSTGATTSETFDTDAKLLRDVRAALAAGRAEQALAMLDARRSNPSDGVLGEERAAARVMTLCRLGRTTEARSESRRFLSAHPRSPLAERVRRTCAGDAPSSTTERSQP